MQLLREYALKLLSRREHSRRELERKLVAKGGSPEVVAEVIEQLAAEKLQSDQRFTESYIRHRTEAGYGLRRILVELAQRGIRELPSGVSGENSEEWLSVLERVWHKKFKGCPPKDEKARAKQSQFLLYRGFAPEQVHDFIRKRGL